MFISAHKRILNSARPATLHNSKILSLCLSEWDKLCTRVARGKILTVTEHFSEFNSYNACNDVIDDEKSNLQACSFKNVVIALGLLREAYWPSLKA